MTYYHKRSFFESSFLLYGKVVQIFISQQKVIFVVFSNYSAQRAPILYFITMNEKMCSILRYLTDDAHILHWVIICCSPGLRKTIDELAGC